MKTKTLIFFLNLLVINNLLFAQKTLRYDDSKLLYERAELLFEHKNYSSAQKEFEEILHSEAFSDDQKIEAHYYIGLCALRLNQPENYSVDNLLDFSIRNPNHPKSQYAIYEIGAYYFQKKKFKEVTDYYNQVSLSDFEDDLRNQGRFQLAYSYFELKDYDFAEKNFDRVKNHENQYRHAANYYSGYIKMKKKKYEEALSDFKIAEQSTSYESAVPVMISNIYYNLARFDDLITYAEPIAESKKSITNKNEIYGLLGEAYFEKLDYRNAAKWYKVYVKGNSSPKPSVNYKYGLSAYKNENYTEAAEQFKRVAGNTDTLQQASAYFLGNSYLKTGNTEFALNAFKQASTAQFDENITQKAMFNEAKLHYNDKNYLESAQVLKRLVSEYPDFREAQEANNLIAESYLNSNDYKAALSYLETLKGPLTRRQKTVYQKVTHQQGVDLFNSRKFSEAIAYFDKSIQNDVNDDLVIETTYWKAESLASLKKWSESVNEYARVFKLDPSKSTSYYYKSFYGIGYAYFNTQQYDKAESKFRNYIKSGIVSSSSIYYSSALVRIGDCNLVKKKFEEARKHYKEAIDVRSPHAAYAKYATGLTYFHQNKSREALEYFGDVVVNHKKDVNYERSLFQQGYINLIGNNYNNAVASFNQLIEDKPQSKSIPEAYYYRGITYKNMETFPSAIKDFDYIIDNFCRVSLDGQTSLAELAITDLEGVSASGGMTSSEYRFRLDKVAECVPGLDIEFKKFELGKSQLYEGSLEESVASLEAFLEEYPNSKYENDAKYHLAEANFGLGKIAETKEYLEYIVANSPDNNYLESVYLLSQIALIEEDNESINKYNLILLKHAKQQTDFLEAHLNLMKSSYALGNYSESITHSEEVLKSDLTLPEAANEASLFQGKSHYNLKDTVRSKTIFEKFVKESTDQFGAESQFYLAKLLQDKGMYSISNDTLFALNKKFAAEKYWVSKSFLMIADNYALLGERFQAMATYESIVKYSGYEDVKAEAQQKWDAILMEKAKEDSVNNAAPDTLEIGGEPEQIEEVDTTIINADE